MKDGRGSHKRLIADTIAATAVRATI